MSILPKDMKNRKTVIIGTGAAILLVSAITLWNWKSSSKKTERSVKHKKSPKESVETKDEDKDVKQSQSVEKEVVAERKVETIEIIETEETVEEKEHMASEEVVIEEPHFDESSSTKSQPLSTTTSNTDEDLIRTPEHEQQELNKKPTTSDTQSFDKKLFDWTEPIAEESPSIVIVDTKSEEKEDFVVVHEDDVEADMPKFNSPKTTLTANAPEFVPQSQQVLNKKPPPKKYLTREQLIEQQRQHHIPRSKARCSHWPHCTNNNCKFFHPYKPCRAGDDCLFAERCMFVHPSDCTTPQREHKQKIDSSSSSVELK